MSSYGASGRFSAALLCLVAAVVTTVKGAYGGTVVALVFMVIMLASAWHARSHVKRPGE